MSENSGDGGGAFLVGLVVGALAGAAAALMLAPCSGEEMRKQIGEKGIELKGEAVRLADEARSQAQRTAEDVREQTGQIPQRGRIVLAENVRKAQQVVQEAQARLGKSAEEAVA